MPVIHFLNVCFGDCNIIQHDSKRISVIDVSNAYDGEDTQEEKAVKAFKESVKESKDVPAGKKDFKQKEHPDNPIHYLRNNVKTDSIWRFIISHPDMDHLDGIRDLYSNFKIPFTWDTNNEKQLDTNANGGRFNPDDWKFYTQIRNGSYTNTKRLPILAGQEDNYWKQDNIKVLCPSPELVKQANDMGNYHDLSYVLLLTVPKKNGGQWKIIFGGDSHDNSWEYILKNYKDLVTDIDVLIAPHHGRGSDRDFSFLNTLRPRLTLFGNASHKHLAYTQYAPKRKNCIRITNNQAGFVILDVKDAGIHLYVKNQEFANWFCQNRNWQNPALNANYKAYPLCTFPG